VRRAKKRWLMMLRPSRAQSGNERLNLRYTVRKFDILSEFCNENGTATKKAICYKPNLCKKSKGFFQRIEEPYC
jgi:hypothetical protein